MSAPQAVLPNLAALRDLSTELTNIQSRLTALEAQVGVGAPGTGIPAGTLQQLQAAVAAAQAGVNANAAQAVANQADIQSLDQNFDRRVDARIANNTVPARNDIAGQIGAPGSNLQNAVDARITAAQAGIRTDITTQIGSSGSGLQQAVDNRVSAKFSAERPGLEAGILSAVGRDMTLPSTTVGGALSGVLTTFGNLNITPINNKIAQLRAGISTESGNLMSQWQALATEIRTNLTLQQRNRPTVGALGTALQNVLTASANLAIAFITQIGIGTAQQTFIAALASVQAWFQNLANWMNAQENINDRIATRADNIRTRLQAISNRL